MVPSSLMPSLRQILQVIHQLALVCVELVLCNDSAVLQLKQHANLLLELLHAVVRSKYIFDKSLLLAFEIFLSDEAAISCYHVKSGTCHEIGDSFYIL